ncbi:MAG: alpha/beta hydrolase [Nitrospira sp.]|nr:alpha/beta hydrolase [Nitrospira sp.]MDH4369368.1 alpha/beta hydrolase [Nitrospira sp.]MDH5347272.1 alpha/beta hydrolase [Nitrospira sp.]MDH5498088.1 alpha/beta hydrolase [Nitrospira sp.]MDH5725259.1 alpha/beta hydrolase [Nitrospira sp.]
MNNPKTSRFQISLLGVLLTTSACTQTAFVAANLPTHFDETVVVQDRAYGPDPAQKLDMYIPANTTKKPFEVVVFLYGGRWTYGAKEDYRFVGSTFADRGFLVVIPDYRKYSRVRFPEFAKDTAKALTWVHDHITESHGNPTRIHVVGHSAGAHIGALVTADPRYLADEGKDRSIIIHDFAGLAVPYAFTPDEPDLEDMFGPPQNYPNMQVTTFIDGTQPPMLLLYGDQDRVVKYANLEKLVQRIKQQGGCVRSRVYHGADHTDLVGALSWWNPQSVPVVDDITKFFESCG